jgi:PIN domain nuclease of toxin-antitoxin system
MTGAPILLDTCAVIWTANGDPISGDAIAAIEQATEDDVPLYISPITAWEIGLLSARGRLALASRPEVWFGKVVATPGVEVAAMPPDLLISSSFLPGSPPGDPADRIVIATAREFGFRIMTRDRKILDYADKGLVMAMAC